MQNKFERFAKSSFTLEIRSKEKVIFRSKKEGLGGLIDFIKKYGKRFKNLTIFDTKVGNAAALLFACLEAKKVYGVLGSKSAKKTLKKFKIKFYFKKTISNILNKKGNDICPMEKLSLLKTPKEFYDCVKYL